MQKKCLALCLSILMGLFALAGCQGKSDPVVATVGDVSIYNSEYREIFDSYASYFGIDDATSADNADAVAYLRDLILDMLIDEKVQLIKAQSLGLDQLTDAMTAEIQTELDSSMTNLSSYYQAEALAEDPTLAGDALTAKTNELVDAYLESIGYTEESLKELYTNQYIINLLFEQSTADVTVAEDDLQAAYQAYLTQAKESYAADASSFETDYYNAATLYYIPKGYRHVKHILIALPEETVGQILTLRDAGEDDAADALRDVSLLDIKDEAASVLSLLASDGSNFDSIMDQYSDDATSADLPNGYAVCKGGQFTEEFINACFAIKKTQTLSGLVAGDYGYHIILYIEPLKEGDVPYENLRAELEEELLSTARESAFTDLCTNWRSEMTVTLYVDSIVYATPEATAATTPSTTTAP